MFHIILRILFTQISTLSSESFTPQGPCSDTPGWYDRNRHNCDHYKKNVCENGAVKQGMEDKVGKDNYFPEQYCCACGKIDTGKHNIRYKAYFQYN